ncbi:hypothetical protein V5799_014739 [Amblyomma americanum]|uniref:Uncharacterized protein n=1 Tax=Amblyomma americanum TaxID=6943 RepID=A0AAQ4E256_AMBAM
MNQGRYTCYCKGATILTYTTCATSIYVFVNDDNYLFQPQKHMDQTVLLNVRFRKHSVVPCLSTHSGAKVQLWKDLGQGEMEEVLLAPP